MIDNHPIQQPQKQRGAIVGSFKINHMIYFYLTIILFTPAYTYHMAVSNGQEPPFPHATVTNTACHYPQAQVFRWTMTTAAGFLLLIFHVIFKFFDKQAIKYQYTGNLYSYMYWPTMISIMGYMAAIGTIDTGGTGDLHTYGAVYFFLCLYFLVVNLTIISVKMRRWDSRFMTRASLNMKVIVASYLSIVWFYCLYGLINEAKDGFKDIGDDKYIVIVEWNLVYAGLIWVLCFLGDFKNVYVVLAAKKPIDIHFDSQSIHNQQVTLNQ